MTNVKKLIPWALFAGAAFLVYKFWQGIQEYLNLQRSDREVKREQETNIGANKQIAEWSKIRKLSKSVTEWNSIADTFYEDTKYSSVSDSKDDAVYQLCRVQNDLDVWQLIKSFGIRQGYYFALPLGEEIGLQAWVHKELSMEDIEKVNKNYLSKNILYRF